MTKKDMYYRKDVLLKGLNNLVATASLKVRENGSTDEDLNAELNLNLAIILQAVHNFNALNQKYSTREMAFKKYDKIYISTYNDAVNVKSNFTEFLDYSRYDNLVSDEKFIVWCMFNLYYFLRTKNTNKKKHILNTYLTKVRNVLRNSSAYASELHLADTFKLKTILFSFLIENS